MSLGWVGKEITPEGNWKLEENKELRGSIQIKILKKKGVDEQKDQVRKIQWIWWVGAHYSW